MDNIMAVAVPGQSWRKTFCLREETNNDGVRGSERHEVADCDVRDEEKTERIEGWKPDFGQYNSAYK